MSLKLGSIIKVNEFLSVNDYIESPNRLFFAILQEDGNFVVYKGTRDNQQEWWWDTKKAGNPGKFFAILQDDGNFVVYKGTSPQDQQEWWWDTNAPAPSEGKPHSSEGKPQEPTNGTHLVTFDINDLARKLVGDAVGLIPYAGKMAASILLYFWPETEKETWEKIEGRAHALINGMFDEKKLQDLKLELQGLKNVVYQLSLYEKHSDTAQRQLQSVINFFEDRQPFFHDKTNLLGTMPFFIEMATMHLIFLKARCDDPKAISKDPVSDATLEGWKNHLHNKIEEYRVDAQACWESATRIRRSMIESRNLEVYDKLTKKSFEYGHPAGVGSSEVNKLARVYTLQSEWELAYYQKYMLPALAWRQLDPYNPTPAWADAGAQLNFWLLGLQNKRLDTHRYSLENMRGSTGKLEYLDIWSGKTTEYIEAKFVGQNLVGNGVKQGRVDRINVPAGQYVKTLSAKFDDKVFAIALTFSNGERVEVASQEAGRLGTWYDAQFPEYGIGGIRISDHCAGILATLQPAGGLR